MKTLLIIVCCVLMVGCATGRQTWMDMLSEQEKTVNVQIEKIPIICKVAQFDSGWVEGTRMLGPEEMSLASNNALKELETLCARPDSLTYKEMGKVSAIAFRLWVDRIMAAVTKFGGAAILSGMPVF